MLLHLSLVVWLDLVLIFLIPRRRSLQRCLDRLLQLPRVPAGWGPAGPPVVLGECARFPVDVQVGNGGAQRGHQVGPVLGPGDPTGVGRLEPVPHPVLLRAQLRPAIRGKPERGRQHPTVAGLPRVLPGGPDLPGRGWAAGRHGAAGQRLPERVGEVAAGWAADQHHRQFRVEAGQPDDRRGELLGGQVRVVVPGGAADDLRRRLGQPAAVDLGVAVGGQMHGEHVDPGDLGQRLGHLLDPVDGVGQTRENLRQAAPPPGALAVLRRQRLGEPRRGGRDGGRGEPWRPEIGPGRHGPFLPPDAVPRGRRAGDNVHRRLLDRLLRARASGHVPVELGGSRHELPVYQVPSTGEDQPCVADEHRIRRGPHGHVQRVGEPRRQLVPGVDQQQRSGDCLAACAGGFHRFHHPTDHRRRRLGRPLRAAPVHDQHTGLHPEPPLDFRLRRHADPQMTCSGP